MNVQAVFSAHFRAHLADCFQKRLAFNIADGAADFRNDYIRVGFFAYCVDKFFDFVGDMGNDLYRLA